MRPVKSALLATLAFAMAGEAMAIGRYNTPSLSCEAIRQILRQEDAAILRYPSTRRPGLVLYDRYVKDTIYCDPNEYADRAFVPSRDDPSCPVLQCKPIDNLDDSFLRIVPRNRL